MAFQARNSAPPGRMGSSLQKVKDQKSLQDSKIDQRSVNNSKKGYKRNTQITNNQKSSTKQFVLRVEEDGEDSLLWSS